MLEAGKLLQNRYRIEKQIGQGGMGAVYVANDERFESIVAIKEMLFAEEIYQKSFDREARLLNSLRHPALPNVTDYFAEGNGQFLVMEYIAGEDLHETLVRTKKPFPLEDVLMWAEQLLDALIYLHNQSAPVIHRDIKPQNLKLAPDKQIILLDFGLAKGNPADITNQTAAKSIFGYSLGYASLEQIQGTGTEPRSDLYSLAATLYHLMTGTPPHDALTRAMTVLNAKPDPLESAHAVNDEIPVGVSEILRRAMSLNANQRPASAEEMREMFANRDKITITEVEKPSAEILFPADIHSRQTEILPGTTPAPRQSDLKTEVLESAESEEKLSQITKLASSNKTKTNGIFKNRYAFASAVFAVLLLFGAGIYGLYIFQPSDRENFMNSPDSKDKTSTNENQNGDANDQINNESLINLDRPEILTDGTAENSAQTETQKPEEPTQNTEQTNRQTSPPPSKNADETSQSDNSDDDEDDELNIGNVKIKGNRVETDEVIIEDDKITIKKPPRPGEPPPPPFTPEEMRRLTPNQRRKLRKVIEIQKRTNQNPPAPPEN